MPIAAPTLIVETNFGRRTLVKRGIARPVAIAPNAYRSGISHGRIRAIGKSYVSFLVRDVVGLSALSLNQAYMGIVLDETKRHCSDASNSRRIATLAKIPVATWSSEGENPTPLNKELERKNRLRTSFFKSGAWPPAELFELTNF
jgi:hypothetical protein